MLDLLLPQRCLVCAAPGGQVCAACTSALRRVGPPLCARCGAPTAWPVHRGVECAGRRLAFARARAAVEYDAPVRRIVGAWKERGLRRLAAWAAVVVVAPGVAAILWALFVSPRARYPLSTPLWLAVQVVLFGCAVIGLVVVGSVVLGVVFAVAVALNLALVLFWRQRDTVT